MILLASVFRCVGKVNTESTKWESFPFRQCDAELLRWQRSQGHAAEQNNYAHPAVDFLQRHPS